MSELTDCVAIFRPGNAQGDRQSLVRTSGQGSSFAPLKLALVLRHADWADDAESVDALAQGRQVLDALWAGLAGVGANCDLTASTVDRLRLLIEKANPVATMTGTYFSAAVAMLSGSQLAAATIGHAQAWRWRLGEPWTLLQASVQPMPGRASGAGPLNAALGLGFNPNEIRSSLLRMASDEFALFLVGAELGNRRDHDPQAHSGAWVPASVRLRQVLDRLGLGASVGVVAVLVPCVGPSSAGSSPG